jgi:hypothetical protein
MIIKRHLAEIATPDSPLGRQPNSPAIPNIVRRNVPNAATFQPGEARRAQHSGVVTYLDNCQNRRGRWAGTLRGAEGRRAGADPALKFFALELPANPRVLWIGRQITRLVE